MFFYCDSFNFVLGAHETVEGWIVSLLIRNHLFSTHVKFSEN